MSYRHSATARAVLRSLVPVICPPEALPLADAIIDHMALTFAAAPVLVHRALAAGLVAYDVGALPRYLRRAQALTGDRAERYFQSWEHGPTPVHVQLARALNQLMSLACYEQPAMMEAVGYHPAGWIAEVTKKRLTVFADDIRKQEASILAPDPLRPARRKEVA
jgi:inactivated superfamily I helicase